MGYGVILLRRKGVTVVFPDGFAATLEIKGSIQTVYGTIIGYRCCDCNRVASLGNWKDYFHIEVPEYDMLGCNICGGYSVEPIYSDYVKKR